MYLLVYTKNNKQERGWYYFEKREQIEKFIEDEHLVNDLCDSYEVTYDHSTCARMINTVSYWHGKIEELKNTFDTLNHDVEMQKIDIDGVIK